MASNTWNYRVLKQNLTDGVVYGVHAVYYTDGVPHSWSSPAAHIQWTADDDSEFVQRQFNRAFAEPVLEVVGNYLREVAQ